MKKLLFLFVIVLIFTSCDYEQRLDEIYPKFEIGQSGNKEVPDSIRKEYQDFINTTLKNTLITKSTSTDLSDVIDEINDIAFDLYAKPYNYLKITYSNREYDYDDIKIENLNKEQKIIYDSLVVNQCKPKVNKSIIDNNTLNKGKYIGRNAVLLYITQQNNKDTLDIDLKRLLVIEDSLEKVYK